MFSLKLPHQGDSNEHTEYTIFIIKRKISLDYAKSAAKRFLLGTQERVRNSCAKRIGVGRGGPGGAGLSPNNLGGGGANIPFAPPPPNNPPTFSFNFYVKREKITNVPS